MSYGEDGILAKSFISFEKTLCRYVNKGALRMIKSDNWGRHINLLKCAQATKFKKKSV